MRNRCKPNHKHSKTYYYRGISVCEEWLNSFENFYEWAINNGYNDNLSLDRIDNDKGYSPSNCHWIPFENQQCNRTNNVYLFYQGKRYCLRQLCRILDFPYKTAYRRYSRWKKANKDFSTEDLFMPIDKAKIAFRYRC